MRSLRARFDLLGISGGLVLGILLTLGVLLLLRTCQAQLTTTPERLAVPAAVAPAPTPKVTLTWNYGATAPERFVVRRSIDGGTWQDVGVVPGATGTGLTWQDTTLPASSEPQTLKYVVYAVAGSAWSEASNVAMTIIGEAEAESVPLGECAAVKRGKKKVIITCVQSGDK